MRSTNASSRYNRYLAIFGEVGGIFSSSGSALRWKEMKECRRESKFYGKIIPACERTCARASERASARGWEGRRVGGSTQTRVHMRALRPSSSNSKKWHGSAKEALRRKFPERRNAANFLIPDTTDRTGNFLRQGRIARRCDVLDKKSSKY